MAKTVNYTPEQVARLQEVYNPSASEVERKQMVRALAAEFDKKENSVIAKLSNMKIYVAKPTAVSKVTGEETAKKDEIAGNLVNLVESVVPELFEGEKKIAHLNVETMAKSNKTDIAGMLRAFETVAKVAYPELFEVEMDETVETDPSAEIVGDAIQEGDTIETVS